MTDIKIPGEQIKIQYVEKQTIDEEQLPPINLFHKATFALLGISSLAGWNAILNALDFFQAKFPQDRFIEVSSVFPIPIMCANFLVGITLVLLGNKIPIEKRLPVSLAGAVITLISICIVGILLKETKAGCALCFIILVLQGLCDSVTNNSSIALSGSTGNGQLIGIFWSATAFSGLIMNILRFVALGAFGVDDLDNGTGLYFGIAAMLYITANYLVYKFKNCEYFLAVKKRDLMLQQRQQQMQAIPNTEKDIDKIQDNQVIITNNQIPTVDQIQTKSNIQTQQQLDAQQVQIIPIYRKILNFFHVIGPAALFIWLNYVQTFMLFPKVSVFFKPSYTIIEIPYAFVWMFTIFNIGDLVGKILGSLKVFQNLNLAFGFVTIRFVYYIFFCSIANQTATEEMQNDVFQWFLMFTFATFNGLNTSVLMSLGPQRAKNVKDRDLINYVDAFSLTFGITCGTILALAMKQ